MTVPPSFMQGGSLHGTAEALQEEVKKADRESGPGLTGGRRREAHARPMGPMAAGGVAVQHLSPEARQGRDRRQHAVAPGGRPDRPAHGRHGAGLAVTWPTRRSTVAGWW